MNDLTVVLSVIGFTLALAGAAWLGRVNYRLAAENEKLLHDVCILQNACDEARHTFRRYAQVHYAEGTPEGGKKADSNGAIADSLARTLADTGYADLWRETIHDLGEQIERAARIAANGG